MEEEVLNLVEILAPKSLENVMMADLKDFIEKFNFNGTTIFVEIYPSKCFSIDETKGKIRTAPKEKNSGTGSQIIFKSKRYDTHETWQLYLTGENLIWLDKKFDSIKDLTDSNFDSNWRKNIMKISPQQIKDYWNDYFPQQKKTTIKRKREITAEKPNKVQALNSNMIPPPSGTGLSNCRSDFKFGLGVVKMGIRDLYPEQGGIWGVDAREQIVSISDNEESLLISIKTSTFAQIKTFPASVPGSPREVISVKNRNMFYFTTSAGLFRVTDLVVVPIFSETANLIFHGLDQANGKVYCTIGNKIRIYDEFTGEFEDLFYPCFDSLTDLGVYSSEAVVTLFALNKLNQLHVMIFEPKPITPLKFRWEVSNIFLVNPTSCENREPLKMNGPSGMAILPFPRDGPKTLFIFVCDTKKQRIIRIDINLQQLLKKRGGELTCQCIPVWTSENYFPLSVSCVQEHEFYFSAVKTLQEHEDQSNRTEIMLFDPVAGKDGTAAPDFELDRLFDSYFGDSHEHQDTSNANNNNTSQNTANREVMESTQADSNEDDEDSAKDESESDDDEENEDDSNFSDMDVNLCNVFKKILALQLSHPEPAPCGRSFFPK